jgi:hypothetical protein
MIRLYTRLVTVHIYDTLHKHWGQIYMMLLVHTNSYIYSTWVDYDAPCAYYHLDTWATLLMVYMTYGSHMLHCVQFIWRRYTYIRTVPSVTSHIPRVGNRTASTASVCMTIGPPHPLLIIQTRPHLSAATSDNFYDVQTPDLRCGTDTTPTCPHGARGPRTPHRWRAGACWLARASNSYWKPWAPNSLSLSLYIYIHTHTAAALKCTCVHFMHRVHRPSPSPPYAARTSFHMRRDPSNTRPTSFPHQGACHLPAPPALAKRAPRGRMRRPT